MFTLRHRAGPLVAVVAFSLVVSGCVVRELSDSGPLPSSSPTPTGAAAQVAFPPGLRDATTGQVYAETEAGVLRLDLRDHTVQRISTPHYDFFRNFAATRRFLVVKKIDDGGGFIVNADGTVGDLPSKLGGPGRLYAAGADRIWVVPEQPTGGVRVISLFNTASPQLTLLSRRTLPAAFGIPVTDTTGHLIAHTDAGILMEMTRLGTKRLATWRRGGEKLAIGKTGILLKKCPHCPVALHARSKTRTKPHATARGLQAVDKLIATYGAEADGQLSPTGRYLAMSVNTNHHPYFRLALADLVTGRTSLIPGALTGINGNDQFVWLNQTSDRWLLAVTDQTLRIVDTKTGTIHNWQHIDVTRIAVTTS